jgi:uncharacterized membrane protein
VTEPVLTVAWLVLAHLVADFVLQNDWIAMHKGATGREGWSALAMHGFHVALCLLPAVLVWGGPGVVYIVVVVLSHMGVDRWKVQATRNADRRAQAQARERLATGGPQVISGLGAAWSPMPGLLFLADQVFHLLFALIGWVVILAGAALVPAFVDAINAAFRDWDRAAVHGVILGLVLLLSIVIVNTRGAFYFVMAMAAPRDIVPVADATGVVAPTPAADPAVALQPPAGPTGATARVSATIAALERLLIVAFVVAGAQVAVAAVIVLDLVARWRQLEDRRFVEHYLMSTLAGLVIAVGSGLLAAAALGSLR